jgi:hypothetical protein
MACLFDDSSGYGKEAKKTRPQYHIYGWWSWWKKKNHEYFIDQKNTKLLAFLSGSNFFKISSNFINGVEYDNVNVHKHKNKNKRKGQNMLDSFR